MNGNGSAQAGSVAGKNGFSLISDEKFREIYAALLKCRMLDERFQNCTKYSRWNGREAITAGVVACLRSGDSVIPTPNGLLAGSLQSSRFTPAETAHLDSTSPLAAAAGNALRHKLEKLGKTTVVFADADEPQHMREVFANASECLLPVLYVFDEESDLADICGNVPVIPVDSSDTVAAYRVAHESIQRARDAGGPTILKCAAWRGAGERDPLLKLERYLSGKKLFHNGWKKRLVRRYATDLDQSREAAIRLLNASTTGLPPVYTHQTNAVA